MAFDAKAFAGVKPKKEDGNKVWGGAPAQAKPSGAAFNKSAAKAESSIAAAITAIQDVKAQMTAAGVPTNFADKVAKAVAGLNSASAELSTLMAVGKNFFK